MTFATMPAKTLISEATTAFKLLNGVVCLYKPLGYTTKRVLKEFGSKMCLDLNQMQSPSREERVEIRRVDLKNEENRIPLENEKVLASYPDGRKHKIEVVKGLNYSDHPLILGERFAPEDFKMVGTGRTSSEVSGVHLYGINHPGTIIAHKIYHGRWLRTYNVSGRFGIATDTLFHTGRIVEKSTYGNVKKHLFHKLLLSVQSSHQKLAFEAAGVPIDSDRAYELASQGLVRPAVSSHPIIYSIKPTHFELPNFTLEIKVVNAEFEYLKRLVHELGLKLHSNAVCTKIHCTNVGPFGVEDALLLKHWTVEHVIQNMKMVRKKLENFDINQRDALLNEGKTQQVMPLDDVLNEEELDDDDSHNTVVVNNEIKK